MGTLDRTDLSGGNITIYGSEIIINVEASDDVSKTEISIGSVEFTFVDGYKPTGGTLNFTGFDSYASSFQTGDIFEATFRPFSITFSAPSSDATLEELSLTGVTLSPAFNSSTTSYTATVPFTTGSTTVTAGPVKGATVSITNGGTTASNGKVDLIKGTNTISINVTAEDGTTKNKYTVTVTREAGDSNAEVESVTLKKNGQTLTGTLSERGNMYVFGDASNPIAYADKDGWTLTVTTESANATVKLSTNAAVNKTASYRFNSLSYTAGGTRFQGMITIKPQDGDAVQYTVMIYVAAPDKNNNLESLSVTADGTELSLIKVDETNYKVNVAESVTKLNITAKAVSALATVTGAGEVTIPANNQIKITVTSQEGVKKDYYISVNKASVNTGITELKVNGKAVTPTGNTYSSGAIAYKESGVSATVAVTVAAGATVSSEGVTFAQVGNVFTATFAGLSENANNKTITVKSAANTTQEYTLVLNVAAGDTTSTLSSVKISKGNTPPYTAELKENKWVISEEIAYADRDGWSLTATANGKATVTGGDGPISLAGGENVIHITVKPEKGKAVTHDVVIKVTAPITSDKLNTLKIEAGSTDITSSLSPTFDPEKYEYTLKVSTDVSELKVTAQAIAEVSGDVGTVDISTKSSLTIVVTPQEGEVKQYIIALTKLNGDNSIRQLSIDGVEATKNDETSYSIEIPSRISSEIKVTIANKATLTSEGITFAQVGNVFTATVSEIQSGNIIFVVTSEAGASATYTLAVTAVAAQSDTTLKTLMVFYGSTEIEHKPYGSDYMIRIPSSYKTLGVVAEANDENADVKIEVLPYNGSISLDGEEYKSNEEIPITEEAVRLRITVTAQNGDYQDYTIWLNVYADHTGDSNPGELEEKPLFTVDMDGTALGIKKDEKDKEFSVSKDTETLTFSVKENDSIKIGVVYGASEAETSEEAGRVRIRVLAEIETDEGKVVTYQAELKQGVNPIVFKVNEISENGVVGEDEYYGISVVRGDTAGQGNNVVWIIIIAVLSAITVALIIVLVIFIVKKKGNEDAPEDGTASVAEVIAEHTVKFEMNGHGKQVKKQKTVNGLISEPEAPVAEGFIFGGWYKDEGCTEKFGFEVTVEQDTTIYAQWTEEPKPEPVVEEAPAEEEKPAEAAAAEEEKPAEEEHEEEHDEEEDNESVQTKHVQSNREKYLTLSHEQRVFYDELKSRAMSTPGAVLNENKTNETIRIGQKRIMKLTIRKEYVVACFFAENSSVTDLKKAVRGKNIRINTRETEIPIYDMRAFEAAEEMLQIVLDGLFNRE